MVSLIFADLPIMGQLKLKISATGFKPYDQTVGFQMKMNGATGGKPSGDDPAAGMAAMSSMMSAFDKDLGNIKMAKRCTGVSQHHCDSQQAHDENGHR